MLTLLQKKKRTRLKLKALATWTVKQNKMNWEEIVATWSGLKNKFEFSNWMKPLEILTQHHFLSQQTKAICKQESWDREERKLWARKEKRKGKEKEVK